MQVLFSRIRYAALSIVVAAVCSEQAASAPTLVARFHRQCAITLEANTPTDAGKPEMAFSPLLGAFLTSAADAIVGFGIELVKTKLDPSQGQFSGKIVIPYDGMFADGKHNPDLGCVMVSVFDPGATQAASIPLKSRPQYERLPMAGTILENTPIAQRLNRLFPGMGTPKIYFEAARIFSTDGSAHYYQPVYAYVGGMAKPHMLSKDPVWEITMSWRNLDDKPFAAWVYKIDGEPPFELHKEALAGTNGGWGALAKLAKDTGTTGVASPFTIQLEMTEHRTATLFAKALQQAVTANEAAIKQAIKDQYPWRREEVEAQAAEALAKADSEARTRLATYLTALDTYGSECKAPSS